jgi:hypothetical protein
MAYNVSHTDGKIYAIVNEGTVNNSLGISLVGQNFNNYGQLIANNFVTLLENSANATPPLNPIAGQLWWDSDAKVLNFFDGNRFKPCSSSAVGHLTPINPIDGDQWWNTDTHQLMVYTGAEWLLVGPSYRKGQNYYGMDPVLLSDAGGANHNVALIKVDGQNAAIINTGVAFEISDNVSGFSKLLPGITLASTLKFNGTATASEKLSETYNADVAYETGSVVVFGGAYEVTTSSTYLNTKIAGVISENIAYTSAGTVFFVPVTTLGKTRCKVTGIVNKGDLLVQSTIAGVATALTNASQWVPGCVIGKSLEDSSTSGVRLVSIAVGRF